MNALAFFNPPRFYRRTVDELSAAGRTDIIQNEILKDRLAEIVYMVEWRANAYDTVVRTAEHYRFLVEEQSRYDFSRTSEDAFLGRYVGVDYDIQRLCRNPAIASAVSAVSFQTQDRLNAYSAVLERYQAFAPLLEDELRSRWGVEMAAASTP